jgi:hypothetical protein
MAPEFALRPISILNSEMETTDFSDRHGFRDANEACDDHPSGESIKPGNSSMIRVHPEIRGSGFPI